MWRTIALAAVVVLAASAAVDAEESVEQILASHLEAKGGAAWEALGSLEIKGSYTAYSVSKPFRLVRQRPNRYLFDRFENKVTVVTGFDGETAWWVNPYYGIEHPFRMGAIDARYLAHRADFDGVLIHPGARGIEIELLGERDLDGSPTIALEATRPDGATSTVYLDPETYLEVAIKGVTGTWGFESQSEIYFDDYREVDGVTLAFYREVVAGDDYSIFEVEEVLTDVDLTDDYFARPTPEAMQALAALAGDWTVTVEQRPFREGQPWPESAGSASFTAEPGGGLVHERFDYVGADGTPVTVLRQWTHDRFAESYRVTSHNDFTGQLKVLEGSKAEGELVLDTLGSGTTDAGREGASVHRRMTVTGLGTDEVLVAVETSSDDGESWTPSRRYTYSRSD